MVDQRHALVSGASIAGLSAAFWLARTGWHVTVLERATAFRDGGQNVDVRGLAREVLARMGLLEAVRAQHTTETGTVVVSSSGAVRARLPTDGPEGATAELEILRGDLARTVLDVLPDAVDVLYGETITEIHEGPDDTTVLTATGRRLRADLVVVAEGVRSSTRDRLFPADQVHRTDLGITMVVGTIPRTATDDSTWRWYNAVGGRSVHLRPDNHGTTRAILACSPGEDLFGLDRADVLSRVRARYTDVGWQAPRVLAAFGDAEDLYVDQLTQIRMPNWYTGRVVLAGDAAWCVTLMGGGGASLALTAGYVLAAAVHNATPGQLQDALRAYQEWMRPLVDGVQRTPAALVRFAYPRTRLGLAARGVADRLLTASLLRFLVTRLTRVDGTERHLPAITGLRTAGY